MKIQANGHERTNVGLLAGAVFWGPSESTAGAGRPSALSPCRHVRAWAHVLFPQSRALLC